MKRHKLKKLISRELIFAVVSALILIVIPQIILYYTVYPNTVMGGITLNTTGMAETRKFLTDLVMTPQRIQVLDREYSLSYQDLGVTLNERATIDALYAPNRLPFPGNYIAWLKSLSSVRTVLTPLEFTDRYDRFIRSLVIDGSEGQDSLSIDRITKTFVYHELGKRYVIDGDDLKNQLISSFGTRKLIRPKLKKLPNPTEYVIKDINRKLTDAYRSPLELEFTIGNKSYRVVLTSDDLRSILTISYSDSDKRPVFDIDRMKLAEILNSRQAVKSIPNTRPIPLPETSASILSAIAARYDGAAIPDISVPLDHIRTRIGKLAPKYVEVDLAKQELYAYTYGNLLKTYTISSGSEYPTPTGWFKILNKAPVAFSTIYNVYMPYWMAFAYSSELKAYFGFHELSYALNETGERVARDRDPIGVPSTGGCIALDIGDAQEFFTFADVGTPVYIYN